MRPTGAATTTSANWRLEIFTLRVTRFTLVRTAPTADYDVLEVATVAIENDHDSGAPYARRHHLCSSRL